jgi:hypothetical protein
MLGSRSVGETEKGQVSEMLGSRNGDMESECGTSLLKTMVQMCIYLFAFFLQEMEHVPSIIETSNMHVPF